MIRKGSFLEFEQLASFPNIIHGVTTRHGKLDFDHVLVPAHHGDRVELYPCENDCDGLITQKKGIALVNTHADCQVALFYDPKLHAIANVHAGWRGQAQNIYAKAVERMQQHFGSKPEDLLVCISPSLGPDASQFINYQTELPESFWPYQIKSNYFDLWEIARQQLLSCGILDQQIEIARICTHSNPHDFHSYRRDKTKERNFTFIILK